MDKHKIREAIDKTLTSHCIKTEFLRQADVEQSNLVITYSLGKNDQAAEQKLNLHLGNTENALAAYVIMKTEDRYGLAPQTPAPMAPPSRSFDVV